MARSLRFNSRQRIKTASDFKTVYRAKQRIFTPEFVFYTRPNTLGKARLGLSLSKKSTRCIANKNRIKRLHREHFRQNQHELGAIDIVISGRKELNNLTQDNDYKTINNVWTQLLQYCNAQHRS